MRAAAILLVCGLLAGPGAAAEDPKAPADAPAQEPKTETLHGLRVEILEPQEKPEAGTSLLLFFHGYSGNGKEAALKLASLTERGFVVAAPWSKDGGWSAPEIESACAVARDLADRYLVIRERRHVAGLSGGGSAVPRVAFDEELGFRTATWVCGNWGGGSVPKGARSRLCGLFLWGAREGPSRVDRYRQSAALLAEKTRTAVARGEEPEPGLGRDRDEDPVIPAKLLPFWIHFLETMEGRFVPGRDLAFDWMGDLEEARVAMDLRKTGGFVYVHAANPEGPEAERTRTLQNEVFFDRVVRHFADQLVAVKLEKGAAKALLESAKVPGTPAVVVFKKGGREVLKSLSGEVGAKALVPLLRAVAADQDLPR